MRRVALIAAAVALLIFSPMPSSLPDLGVSTGYSSWRDYPIEGFGADTQGGEHGTPYAVTSLADAGPGTLRDAISQSDRRITFEVGGTIEVQTTLRVTGQNITIDGGGAPSPGITITAAHSGVYSSLLDIRGAHDVIIRDIRVQDAPDPSLGDNLRIWDGAYNIVVDHCSFRRGGDGCLDISDGANNITVQWCIIAETVKNSLIRTDVSNLSIHHNLYVHGEERNPQLDDATGVDFVNNIIYGWGGNYGTRIRNGASANLVGNYYIPGPGSDASDAVVLVGDAGPVYMSGNNLPPQCPASSTAGARLPAPPVAEMTPAEALIEVLESAGARPRDDQDLEYIGDVAATPVQSTSWGQIKDHFR
jgi:pectate lyase